MSEKKCRLETNLIHAGEPKPRPDGAVAMPIYQSATFESAGAESYHDLKYIRLNNTPNHVALAAKLSAIAGAQAGLVTASGMAAITATLLTLLKSGDHILIQDCVYGGTHNFATHDLADMGIAFDFIDGRDPESWIRKLRGNTKVIYAESITNPLMEVIDLAAVPSFAREQGLLSVVDNTIPTPFNYKPLEHGFDISLHSCTKYLNGHSDIVAGAVLGRAPLVERITHKLNHLGGSLDPHACFLLHRGLKTLALRMERHNENALALARFLSGRNEIAKVNYPGLEHTPGFMRYKPWFRGYSGMLSFELTGGMAAAKRFISRLNLAVSAPSLGGVESLVTLPSETAHAGMTQEERAASGISESLIRFSVGIEAIEDLVDDIEQALED